MIMTLSISNDFNLLSLLWPLTQYDEEGYPIEEEWDEDLEDEDFDQEDLEDLDEDDVEESTGDDETEWG